MFPPRVPSPLTAAFALAFTGFASADESRFDPPHRGVHLGIRIDLGDDGLRVDSVLPSGAAARAGVEEGDLLLRIGEWSHDAEDGDIVGYLAQLEPAPTLARVRREGSELDLEIEPDPLLVATARAIAEHIQKHRLFRRAGAGDLEALATDLTAAVHSTDTREAAYAAMNSIIDRFGISHTAILTPWVRENLFGPGEHYHLGMFVQAIDDGGKTRFFARSLMHGSPARESGLRIGDELVAVNGKAFGDSPRRTLAGYEARRRMFAVQLDRDELVRLEFRRRRDGKVRSVAVVADRPLDAVSSARESVRVFGEGDRAIGYVHFWNVMSADNIEVLNEALENEFAEAKALAVDLRGRGGNIAVIVALSRILAGIDRPVALLIDREARSAKEMLAQRLKGRSHITLVGETTAGAVLPANFVELPGGGQLMLPVGMGDAMIRLFNRGQRLEGRGTIPDVAVDAPLPYRAGNDVILKRALRLLRRQLSGQLLKL